MLQVLFPISRMPGAEDTERQPSWRTGAMDAQGDPKYKVPGLALDGRRMEVVCVIKELIVLVTVYTIGNAR
jgi:hypothetical protein